MAKRAPRDRRRRRLRVGECGRPDGWVLPAARHCGSRYMQAMDGPPTGAENSLGGRGVRWARRLDWCVWSISTPPTGSSGAPPRTVGLLARSRRREYQRSLTTNSSIAQEMYSNLRFVGSATSTVSAQRQQRADRNRHCALTAGTQLNSRSLACSPMSAPFDVLIPISGASALSRRLDDPSSV